MHWFDLERFFPEVKRTLTSDGLLAAMGYGLIRTFPEADEIIGHFYKNITGPFWDTERKIVEEKYLTIPFPFKESACHGFESSYTWSIAHVLGYLSTWSAVAHFKKDEGFDPISLIEEKLKKCWGTGEREVSFPLFVRVGKSV